MWSTFPMGVMPSLTLPLFRLCLPGWIVWVSTKLLIVITLCIHARRRTYALVIYSQTYLSAQLTSSCIMRISVRLMGRQGSCSRFGEAESAAE